MGKKGTAEAAMAAAELSATQHAEAMSAVDELLQLLAATSGEEGGDVGEGEEEMRAGKEEKAEVGGGVEDAKMIEEHAEAIAAASFRHDRTDAITMASSVRPSSPHIHSTPSSSSSSCPS
jgi:hypothetical protein